jgi:tetratricopeptide (TPR) repeat protein
MKYKLLICLTALIFMSAFAHSAAPQKTTSLASGTTTVAVKLEKAQAKTNNDSIVTPNDYLKLTLDQQTQMIDKNWKSIQIFVTIISIFIAFVGVAAAIYINSVRKSSENRIKEWEKRADEACKKIEELRLYSENLIEGELKKKIDDYLSDADKIKNIVTESGQRVETMEKQAKIIEEWIKKGEEKITPEQKEKLEKQVRIIEKKPENMRTSDDYFKMARRAVDTNKKIKFYEKSIALDPNNFSAYFFLGIIYEEKEEYDKSIESFDKTLALSSYPFYYICKSRVLIKRNREGDLDKSILLLEKAADEGFDDIKSFYNNTDDVSDVIKQKYKERFDAIVRKIEENGKKFDDDSD